MKRTLYIFLTLVVFITCRQKESPAVDGAHVGKIHSVAILGNSIVRHAPSQDLGWPGDWGMAASAMDKDFVHLLIKDIHERDSSVTVQFENIAAFELNFRTFDFSTIDRMRNSDMIIMKICENIRIESDDEERFIERLDSLINYLDPNHRAVRVIVDGFWDMKKKNAMLREYAEERNYPFIRTSDLSSDESNTAVGLFKNADVAEHPSDKGMLLIKERIWSYVKKYFPGERTKGNQDL